MKQLCSSFELDVRVFNKALGQASNFRKLVLDIVGKFDRLGLLQQLDLRMACLSNIMHSQRSNSRSL